MKSDTIYLNHKKLNMEKILDTFLINLICLIIIIECSIGIHKNTKVTRKITLHRLGKNTESQETFYECKICKQQKATI